MSSRAACIVVVALLVGCSGTELSDEAAQALQEHTVDVRTAAENRDLAGAQEALDRLHASLDEHTASGDVSARRAREIAAAAELVAERLPMLSPPPAEQPPDHGPPAEPPPARPPRGDAAEEAEKAQEEAEKAAEEAAEEAEKAAEEAAEEAEKAAEEAAKDAEEAEKDAGQKPEEPPGRRPNAS